MMKRTTKVAFFDVDETLIATKSMFDFLVFLGEIEPRVDASVVIAEMQRLSQKGIDRSQINVAFWHSFAGLSQADVQRAARSWADRKLVDRAGFLIESSIRCLGRHKRDGDLVVFVSGSSVDILAPIADVLGADHVLATRMHVADGRYTGEIFSPVMIGAGKREAAQSFLDEIGATASDCFAYGDHPSDLSLLELVGHPFAIGLGSELAYIAESRNWPVLPGMESLKREGEIA